MPPETAARLDGLLRDFEARARAQVVVVILPELPSPSLEDFTVRAAQAWRLGSKGLDDGVVLFVFVKERRLRLEVGYGLEDRIPDVTAKRILADVVAPEIKAGRAGAGLEAGLHALMAAIEGRPSTTPGGAVTDDVPVPPSEPLVDTADLLPAEREASLVARVEEFRNASACRLSIVLLPGGPDRYATSYLDPQLFAVRSFFRSRPRPGGAEDAEYFQGLEADPSGLLFVFTGDEPGQAAFGFFGSGTCPAAATARAILDHELAPRFAADPAGALETALDLFGRARRGEYTPPTPAPLPPPTPTAVDSLVTVVAAIGSFRFLGLPIGGFGLLVAFVTVVTLPTRGLAIRRRMKQGQGFGYAFLREAAVVATLLFTSSGRSYSSAGSSRGGSSGGFSGGGGRFGGGGASGSW